MTTPLSPSPQKAVKQFAKEHSDFAGLVCVLSYAPNGRNGRRGLVRKETLFSIQDCQIQRVRLANSQGSIGVLVDICGLQTGTLPTMNVTFNPGKTPKQKRDEAMAVWFRRTMAKETV